MNESTKIDIARLKTEGLMKQKEPDLFCARVRVVGGHLTAEQLSAVAHLAESCAQGSVHLTTRQALEIPNVHVSEFGNLRSGLAAAGLELAKGGARVRTITACQGGSCTHGLVDPQKLAGSIDELVSHRSDLPHKFKIGISGCPNACTKPQENDLGVMGTATKTFHSELCNQCGKCVRLCRPHAIEISEGKLICSEDACVQCGDCAFGCPTGAWEIVESSYAVFVGGTMGRKPRLADRLPYTTASEQDLLRLVERTIGWFVEYGQPKERLGRTIERVGLESLLSHLQVA